MKSAVLSDSHFKLPAAPLHRKILLSLKQENISVLFLVGDIQDSSPDEMDEYFSLVREILPDVIVITVFGNHDFKHLAHAKNTPQKKGDKIFDSIQKRQHESGPSWDQTISLHKKLCQKHQVLSLNGESHQLTDKTTVLGFNGWYGAETKENPTSDYLYLPTTISGKDAFDYLHEKAKNDFNKILKLKVAKNVV